MNYPIDKHSGKPAYLQLYEHLRRHITDGTYPFGSRLPSKRLLSEETGVSVITVEHAYALLCDEGYAEARHRSGYFAVYSDAAHTVPDVAADDDATAPTAALSAAEHIPFSVLAKTMRRVLAEQGDALLVRSQNHGDPVLRRAIAAYLARAVGLSVRPEQVIIGSGAEYLYSLLAQLLGARRFAIENPSYEKIRRVYEACGITCDRLAMGRDGIRAAELSRTTATVLHVTPFHSFPSGISASASKRAAYVRWAEERDGILIEDNYDSELTVSSKNVDPLFSLDDRRVIYMNTFSHTVAPSIRVGYMVLPSALLPAFEERLGFYSCTVPLFEQHVLASLLDSGDFERHIHRVRRRKRRQAE